MPMVPMLSGFGDDEHGRHRATNEQSAQHLAAIYGALHMSTSRYPSPSLTVLGDAVKEVAS